MSKFFDESQNNLGIDTESQDLGKEISKIESQIKVISAMRSGIKDESILHGLLQGIHIDESLKSSIDMESLIGKAGDQDLVSIYKNSTTMKGGADNKAEDAVEDNIDDEIHSKDSELSKRLEAVMKQIKSLITTYVNECLDKGIAPDLSFINTMIQAAQDDNSQDFIDGEKIGNESAQAFGGIQNDFKELGESGIDNDKFRELVNGMKKEGTQFSFDDLRSVLESSKKDGLNEVTEGVCPDELDAIKATLKKNTTSGSSNIPIPDGRGPSGPGRNPL